ncbi:MAG: ATP-binding protein [Pseudomonadales bacterium]|nr:ATP-binding protein [Pseudomonadales bacterium]
MNKVYANKQVVISTDVTEQNFFGDERDLMELLGNLIDNACKYGSGKVSLKVSRDASTQHLLFEVEDNGLGIPKGKRDGVLSRGMRLDSQEAGQGIGLAVVVEIVARYNGEIQISDAQLGGARISVSFPA